MSELYPPWHHLKSRKVISWPGTAETGTREEDASGPRCGHAGIHGAPGPSFRRHQAIREANRRRKGGRAVIPRPPPRTRKHGGSRPTYVLVGARLVATVQSELKHCAAAAAALSRPSGLRDIWRSRVTVTVSRFSAPPLTMFSMRSKIMLILVALVLLYRRLTRKWKSLKGKVRAIRRACSVNSRLIHHRWRW